MSQSQTERAWRETRLAENAAVMRGAFRGFGILLIGGLVQPLIGLVAPPLGAVWLVLVALAAFTSAAWIATLSHGTFRSGPTAALLSYGLMLPVVWMGAGGRIDLVQVAATTATALAVGASAAFVKLRSHAVRG